jgi:uncharacterized protein
VKIGVVGAGISGLCAAWLLSKRHHVTLLERNAHIGGHSDTAVVLEPANRRIAIDTGFIVYNTSCYPNLVALFDHLDVPTAKTTMSFSLSLGSGAYEYSGDGMAGLFAQRRNLLSISHWGMVKDILRFFRQVSALDADSLDLDLSLGAWLEANGYGDFFVRRHILPMGAAIWSTPADQMLSFPIAAFARFFANHGLLIPDVDKRPIWRTVRGGSREYVKRMLEDFPGKYSTRARVASIRRQTHGVDVLMADGRAESFDHCVVATHADEAARLLADADEGERGILGAFRYSENLALLHTDARVMPRRKRAWSSWNYTGDGAGNKLSVTYWMNRLQPLETETDYFVTLNPWREIADQCILKRAVYRHPVFHSNAMAAQRELWSLQGRRRTWFAGSYFGYGFHEDGLQAGLAVAEDLGDLKRPWSVAGERDRIFSASADAVSATRVAAE